MDWNGFIERRGGVHLLAMQALPNSMYFGHGPTGFGLTWVVIPTSEGARGEGYIPDGVNWYKHKNTWQKQPCLAKWELPRGVH